MSLLNITAEEGELAQCIQRLSQIMYPSLMEAWCILLRDYFHVVHQALKEHLFIDEKMWDMSRSDDVVVIQITSIPHSKEMQCDFYRVFVSALEQLLDIHSDDIFSNVMTSQSRYWSFSME